MNFQFPNFLEISSNEKTDVYVCAMGFEDRSLGSNRDLSQKNFSSKFTCILKYDIHKTENSRNRSEIESTIQSFSNEYCYIDYLTNNREKFHRRFSLRLDKLSINTFTINISSMNSHMIICILNYALNNAKKIKIIYSNPVGYYSTLSTEDTFSSGIKEIFSLKEFRGTILPGYPLIAIILLGFDIIRAHGILLDLQPSKRIGIIPNSLIEKDRKLSNRMLTEHERIFEPGEDIYSFNIFDYQSVIKKLIGLRNTYVENNNISVILDGAKIHSIAALLFAKKFKDIQLIFSSPMKYYPNRYSYGTKNTYKLEITKEWLDKFLSPTTIFDKL